MWCGRPTPSDGGGVLPGGFADEVEVHRSHLGMIERDKVAVTLVTVEKLAKGLDMSMTELAAQTESEH